MLIDSVCAYCGVGCDISATVQNNQIKSISAKKEGTVSQGELCIKGKFGYDFVHSPNRLKKVKIKKSFLEKNRLFFSSSLLQEIDKYHTHDDGYIYPTLSLAYKITAWKIKQIITKYSPDSFAAIGGARGNCESSYLLQKFTRQIIKSPHIDNCARVCHAPTLKGMRSVIGEGAATNPFSDIKKSEFLIIFGSNTTEAHPIVANKIVSAKKRGLKLALFDVRDIQLSKYADHNCIIPYESNLLVVNMLAFTIITEELYDKKFVKKRVKHFDKYKDELINDPHSNPDFFLKIKGYEHLSSQIKEVAREYAKSRSMILWGLGVTEHIDGSYTTASLCNLALLCGNISKEGAGLIPLRGQNNVQGTCDVGCLPYYTPDYQKPLTEGKKTPDIIDSIIDDEIKILFNMGEDIAHIHANQNKISTALKKLELLVVNELFDNEITKYADIVFGIKSAYEKSGIYINAERRLHLSQPLVTNDLPDDWEVLQGIAKELGDDLNYNSSRDIWEEVRVVAPNRFSGASYEKLEKNRIQGLQWPIEEKETPILHKESFRTQDGYGHLRYKRYFLRGMVKELLEDNLNHFYLTTGRVIVHYNNTAQTRQSPKLFSKHKEDVLLISFHDKEMFQKYTHLVVTSPYGKTRPLKIKFSKKIKKHTLFVSFHHAKSHINYLFGDESDELTKTARFKSIKVQLEPI